MPDTLILDFSEDWQSLQRGQTRQEFEQKVLPEYLAKQRWFASKGAEIQRAEMMSRFVFPSPGSNYLLATFRAHLGGGRHEDYFLPLAVDWNLSQGDLRPDSSEILAFVRKGETTGVIKDALPEPGFIAALVRTAGKDLEMANDKCKLSFRHTDAYFGLQGEDEQNIKKLGAEQSNSSILIAKKMILKAYRKLEPGVQPELEMGEYLTTVAHYQNTPPLLGSVELIEGSGPPTALVVIQGFVPNQGDGWSYTLNHLKHAFAGLLNGNHEDAANHGYAALSERLGIRIAELHRAFAIESGNPAFHPEPVTHTDVAGWQAQIRSEAETTFGLLTSSESLLPPEQHKRVHELLYRKDQILSLITAFKLPPESSLKKTRFHGDLHLGQVLVSGNDFYIIDFEGEPARPFAQRRGKSSPLKDVAGMLRSLNYAAWSALFEAGAGEPDKMQALEKPATEWERESSSALLRGYTNIINGCPSCPTDPVTFRQLLDLFILEKALYEVRYELANRPTWLRIPVEGILNLIERAKAE